MNEFNNIYPDFWRIVKPHTYGPYVMDFESNQFESVCKIIRENMHYFNIGNLMQIDAYLTDLIGYLSGNNEDGFNQVLRFNWELDDLLVEKKAETRQFLEYITPKISKYHFINNDLLINPYDKINNEDDNEDDFTSLRVLMELRKETLKYNYYLMLFVYDFTLRMQKVKSEIIKYELVRINSKNYTLSPLDVIINELLLQYQEIHKEFIIYNNKLSKIQYNREHLYLWPNNLHILNDYYNKYFDFDKKKFNSVINESMSEGIIV